MVLNLFKYASLRVLVILVPFLMPSLSYSATTYKLAQDPSKLFPALSGQCGALIALYPSISHCDENLPGDGVTYQQYNYTVPAGNGQFAIQLNSTSVNCDQLVPSYIGYIENESGQCVLPPETTCNIGDHYYSNAQLTLISQEPRNIGGCEYIQNQTLFCSYSTSTEEVLCQVRFESTGNTSELPEVIVGTPEQANIPDPTQSYQQPSISDTNVTPPVVTTAPDGTVTTNEDSTIVSDTGENINVTETDQFIFVKESDGSTTVIQKNKTTVSNPDGSSSTNEQKTTTSTSGGSKDTVIPKDGSNPTVTQTQPTTNTQTVNFQKLFDDLGNLISSSSSSSGSNNEPAPEVDENGDKQYSEGTTETGSYSEALTGQQTELEEQKGALLAKYNEIKSDITAMFSFNHSGSGALPCPPPVTIEGFGSVDICLTNYESQLSIVALVLLLCASFLALAIILR